MDWSKLNKLVEAVNTYYAFAVMMYVAVLYVSKNSQIFLWILFALTPVIAGWTGYLLKSYLESRNEKHGFRLLSNTMTYEVLGADKYRYTLHAVIQAEANRMMVYPVGLQWSGEGIAHMPRLSDPDQYLIGTITKYDREKKLARVAPYKEVVSSESDWNYWFIGLQRALYKGETAEITYSQEFHDLKKKAKPYIYHMVNTSVKQLELSVRFPAEALPVKVTGSYFSLKDRRRIYTSADVQYSPDKQWASWVVKKPKFGYCYRIDWRY